MQRKWGVRRGLRCLSSKLTNSFKPTENFHTRCRNWKILTKANIYLKVQVRKGVNLSAYQTIVPNSAWIKISACTHHSEKKKKKIFLPLIEHSASLWNNHSMHFWLLGEFCGHQKRAFIIFGTLTSSISGLSSFYNNTVHGNNVVVSPVKNSHAPVQFVL